MLTVTFRTRTNVTLDIEFLHREPGISYGLRIIPWVRITDRSEGVDVNGAGSRAIGCVDRNDAGEVMEVHILAVFVYRTGMVASASSGDDEVTSESHELHAHLVDLAVAQFDLDVAVWTAP